MLLCRNDHHQIATHQRAFCICYGICAHRFGVALIVSLLVNQPTKVSRVVESRNGVSRTTWKQAANGLIRDVVHLWLVIN